MPDDDKTLSDIYEAIKQLSESILFRYPRIEPYPPLKLLAYCGGGYEGRPLTLGPQQDIELLRWENYPCHLYTTILKVTMPDATLPYVGYIVDFDRFEDIADWTIEEYNELGLGPANVGPYEGYGGCTLYNLVTLQYACLTKWDYLASEYLDVRLRNWTNVSVDVNILDVQFWSSGGLENLKYALWPWKGFT